MIKVEGKKKAPPARARFPSGPGHSPPRVGIRHHFLDFVVKSLSHGQGERNSLQMERDSQRTRKGGKRPESWGGTRASPKGHSMEGPGLGGDLGSELSKNTGATGSQRFLSARRRLRKYSARYLLPQPPGGHCSHPPPPRPSPPPPLAPLRKLKHRAGK